MSINPWFSRKIGTAASLLIIDTSKWNENVIRNKIKTKPREHTRHEKSLRQDIHPPISIKNITQTKLESYPHAKSNLSTV